MSAGVRVPITTAELHAQAIAAGLWTACERIEIAGSIRRRSPDVGDIEIVAVPRIVDEPDGLWGSAPQNRLTAAVDAAIALGDLAPHPTDPKRGERYSKLLHPASGLQVDLFSATAETFGLILLIRTGPADYSRRFVADLRGVGLHAGHGQLHRGGMGCGTYVCEVIPTPSEHDVYAAAGWSYVHPGERR